MGSVKPRILLTYIESGMGHIMSMRSIESALQDGYANELEIVPCDVMHGGRISRSFEKFLTTQVKLTNSVKGWGDCVFKLLETLEKRNFRDSIHKTLFRKPVEETIEYMRSFAPDTVVSTHYFITYCAVELKRRYMPDLDIVTYNPDNNTHVWWDNREGIFIVNNDTALEEAVSVRHFDTEKVKSTPFALRKEISGNIPDKRACRIKYSLPDRFTVIVADGAYAKGKAQKCVRAIIKNDPPVNLIFVAGKNKGALKKFERVAKALRRKGKKVNLVVYGFVSEIYELYAAADLFITKSGPNSLLDCLHEGTPVVINNCPHPIERASYRLFVCDMECGKGIFEPEAVADYVCGCSTSPDASLAHYRRKAREVADMRNGAEDIAKIIADASLKGRR